MIDPLNSVNDPLFFMHHGAIDYLWSIWQEQDPTKRLYDLDASKDRSLGASAWQTRMDMGAFGPTRTVKDVADPQNRDGSGILCFKYEGMPIEKYLS